MLVKKSNFALYFGTRDVFPDSLIEGAREEIPRLLKKAGHEVLMTDVSLTPFGAVETREHGKNYSKWLQDIKGKYDGIIIVLPNFGDENGAMAAFQDVDVPVLILAYPDDLDKMAPGQRRDAFCGKFSIMDVFCQVKIKFTVRKPHVVVPGSAGFNDNIDFFDRVCRVVKGLRRMRVGAIGARVTPFKTVRIDEITLQNHGITTEVFDLSYVIGQMDSVSKSDLQAKIDKINSFADFSPTPPASQEKISRLACALDRIVQENELNAIALRCWFELQDQLQISPCVILSEMNNRGIEGACEVDIGNAIAMHALKLASGAPAGCLDWNNNYGDDENKCILFHCGPIPDDLMVKHGRVTDHELIACAVGPGKSYGCNQGRIKPQDMTFGSLLTKDGRMKFFLGEAKFTDDPIAPEFFGCAGVAEFNNLQDIFLEIGKAGHRHHVSVTSGHVMAPMVEAFENYLGFDVRAFD
jgi:L-fucose isomerase-like protein